MINRLLFLPLLILTTNLVAQNNIIDKSKNFKKVNKDIIALFNEYPLVAVGEGFHNSALTFEWLESIVHEKDFPKKVSNIVVEFGTSKYQSTMDDFIKGKDVADSLFKKCWRSTTQLFVWDNPIYEKFFREIRKVNSGLPDKHKIRVVLADLPFEKRNEISDEHAFTIIKNEILSKNQTALLIYGDLHFVKRDIFLNYANAKETAIKDRTLVQFLDIEYPGKVFSILGSVNTNDPIIKKTISDSKITYPSFHVTSKSSLGLIDFSKYYPWAEERTDVQGNPIDSSQWLNLPTKEIFDGILFRGKWEDQIEIAPRPDEIYADTVYLNELIARSKISGEKRRQNTFEYFKFRWSPEYEPLIKTLREMDSIVIDKEFLSIKKKHNELNWAYILNGLGYKFLREKETNLSIAIFELATREFPTVSNTFDSLGDGYIAGGNKVKAINAFTKALQLNPNNTRAKDKLKDLIDR